VSYCPVTPGAASFTVLANGDVKPVDPNKNNPYVVRAARLEQVGDCVTLGASANNIWENTYLGDFLAPSSVNPVDLDAASWTNNAYITLDALSSPKQIIFHGFINNPGAQAWTGGDVQICVVDSPLVLRVSFDSKQFDLQVPFPYFLDMAVSFPTSNYVFPFSHITETHVAGNLPILSNKALQDCRTQQATVGTLRNVGECIIVDLSFLHSDGYFIVGQWKDFSNPPLPTNIKTCSNYVNGQALILNAASQRVDVCGFPVPFSSETVCEANTDGFAGFKSLTICKTACGISTRIVSAECDLALEFGLPGDFVMWATGVQVLTNGQIDYSRSLCAFYEPVANTVNAFTATCPPQDN